MILNVKWFIFGVFLNVYGCIGHKILVVFPIAGKSHGILGDNVVKHLLNAGHEVTYITPFVKKNVHPNLIQIDVNNTAKLFNENSINMKKIMDKELNFQNVDILNNLIMEVGKVTLQNPNTQKLIKDPKQKFDVVIGEWLFTEVYATLSTVFDCPMIWISTLDPHWIVLSLVDGPSNPAYSGDLLSTNVPPLSFLQRLEELWTLIISLYKRNYVYYIKANEIYQELIVPVLKERGKVIPTYESIQHNASIILGNSNAVLGDGLSLPQNYKHIGGYFVDEDVKPLPEDLKKIMDNSKHGVIYFSMGSNLKSKDLPADTKKGLLNVFGKLKQTVIWKFEEILPDLPKNVHIISWAPQQSILAHPKMVVFVTHGGMLSVTEAVHFGVPLITIPVFADQFTNAKRVERKGIGRKIDLSYTMHEDLKLALDDILQNLKYSQKAKEMSQAFHNVPMKLKDALCFWVNHVVVTNGAYHLRSFANQMPLYQKIYLDLLALISIIIFIFVFILKLIFVNQNSQMKKDKRL